MLLSVLLSHTANDFSAHDIQYPHQDSKRVLECLQKSLRIANSATEEIVTVQLYCDTLDQYVYYFDRGASAVSTFGNTMTLKNHTEVLLLLRLLPNTSIVWLNS
jgi:hypothetical protein